MALTPAGSDNRYGDTPLPHMALIGGSFARPKNRRQPISKRPENKPRSRYAMSARKHSTSSSVRLATKARTIIPSFTGSLR